MTKLTALVAGMVLLLAGTACTNEPDPATPATKATSTPTAVTTVGGRRTPVAGFGEVAFRVSTMPAAARCALLAETLEQQEKGLMNRRDLAGYDGMLFVFAAPTMTGFWMKDTPLPLSIAYFDASGRFVSSADMAPCLGRGDNCPGYPAAAPYKYALEVAQGGLGGLGIGPGSALTAGGACA